MPKCAYWNVITFHIRYTKRCLLIEKMPIEWKCTYWMKICLLTENMSIELKGAYWMKKVHIDWKCAYWMKKYILIEKLPIEKWKDTIVWYF